MEFNVNKLVCLFIFTHQLGIYPLFAFSNDDVDYVSALLNASYKDMMTEAKQLRIRKHITGHGIFGTGAARKPASGYIYYLRNEDWCRPVLPKISNLYKPWIALIERGNCEFVTKILNAKMVNASAVIIFDNDSTSLDGTVMKCYGTGDIAAVSISRQFGKQLASISAFSRTHMRISIGRYRYRRKRDWQAGKTSVLFVLVSFILLMCISLAWLVFYYVQRFRYFYARDKKEVCNI